MSDSDQQLKAKVFTYDLNPSINIRSVDSNWDSGHIVNGMMADA